MGPGLILAMVKMQEQYTMAAQLFSLGWLGGGKDKEIFSQATPPQHMSPKQTVLLILRANDLKFGSL